MVRTLQAVALSLLCFVARGDILLTFDDAAENEVVSERYRGVRLYGIGEGGPFDVTADLPCVVSAASVPHVISFRDPAGCPESNNIQGWFEAVFELEQPWVSIDIIHAGSGSASYLNAYAGPDEADFLDQKLANIGESWRNVPQTLRIEREPQERQITRIKFGGFNFDANQTAFDNLRFALRPVASAAKSFAAIKALY